MEKAEINNYIRENKVFRENLKNTLKILENFPNYEDLQISMQQTVELIELSKKDLKELEKEKNDLLNEYVVFATAFARDYRKKNDGVFKNKKFIIAKKHIENTPARINLATDIVEIHNKLKCNFSMLLFLLVVVYVLEGDTTKDFIKADKKALKLANSISFFSIKDFEKSFCKTISQNNIELNKKRCKKMKKLLKKIQNINT